MRLPWAGRYFVLWGSRIYRKVLQKGAYAGTLYRAGARSCGSRCVPTEGDKADSLLETKTTADLTGSAGYVLLGREPFVQGHCSQPQGRFQEHREYKGATGTEIAEARALDTRDNSHWTDPPADVARTYEFYFAPGVVARRESPGFSLVRPNGQIVGYARGRTALHTGRACAQYP